RLVTRDGERPLEWPTPLVAPGEPAPLRPTWPKAADGGRTVRVPLSALAHARGGDKGDTCNIGVIARAPEIYPWLRRMLTEAVVQRRFRGICQGAVERHEVPNLWALNFLLGASLGGGGTVSLRLDAQGKTLSHALLAMIVRAPRALLEAAQREDNAHRMLLGLAPRAARVPAAETAVAVPPAAPEPARRSVALPKSAAAKPGP